MENLSQRYDAIVVGSGPGGTVKIGELLDENLKTRQDNLYVCDCSVIPESWGLPPTLSLICLGKRLAKHLISLNINEDHRSDESLCQTE